MFFHIIQNASTLSSHPNDFSVAELPLSSTLWRVIFLRLMSAWGKPIRSNPKWVWMEWWWMWVSLFGSELLSRDFACVALAPCHMCTIGWRLSDLIHTLELQELPNSSKPTQNQSHYFVWKVLRTRVTFNRKETNHKRLSLLGSQMDLCDLIGREWWMDSKTRWHTFSPSYISTIFTLPEQLKNIVASRAKVSF